MGTPQYTSEYFLVGIHTYTRDVGHIIFWGKGDTLWVAVTVGHLSTPLSASPS